MSSTIAAIATAQAAAGIGVIRISGDGARAVADKVFVHINNKKISGASGYTALYGKIVENGTPVDDAVALVFAAPHSYTGEDVVELSCHGGLYLMQKVLRLVFAAGALPAEPGEFTKRAFLNGKMDLTQAESVMQLISAQGEEAVKAALAVHEGALTGQIQGVKEKLLYCAAHMSVWADYPDEDIETLEKENLLASLKEQERVLKKLLDGFDAGRVLREGVDTVIVGRPNVGKSTLMNFLSGEKRSIVTPIAGTTRDIVEQTVRLGSVVLNLADTAGIRDTTDEIERIGVDMAKSRMEKAGFILAVFDASQSLNEEDNFLIEQIKDKNAVAVLNKTDLAQVTDEARLRDRLKNVVCISAENGTGRDELVKAVEEVLGTSALNPADGILSTERQRNCCVKAHECLTQAISALSAGITLDAVNVCVDCALTALMELTGERATEEVSKEVFTKFCVGK